jgi:hypothetical protein
MYLVLRPPWAGRGAPIAIDGGAVAAAPSDAPPAKKKKPRHRGGGGGGARAANPANEGDTEDVDLGPTTVVLTAADRAQETRGDSVALPKQKLDMGAGGAEARALDQGEISGVINGQSGGVQACVVQGATNTDLHAASIEVQMVVDGGGRVTATRVSAPHYLFTKGLLACVQGATGRIHFPSTGAPTLVSFPVNLN